MAMSPSRWPGTLPPPTLDSIQAMQSMYAPPKGEEFKRWKAMILDHIDKRRDQYPDTFAAVFPRAYRFYRLIILASSRFSTFLLRPLTKLRRSLFELCVGKLGNIKDRPSINAKEPVNIPPELLEIILRYSDAKIQIHTAWNVSQIWRHTIRYILRSSKGPVSFHASNAGPAVALNHDIGTSVVDRLLEPSAQEYQQLLHSISVIRRGYDECSKRHGGRPGDEIVFWPWFSYRGFWPPYIPSRLLASQNLPPAMLYQEDMFHDLARWKGKLRSSKYEDFSQFLLNPHLEGLLSGRLTYNLGMYEVALAPTATCHDMIFSSTPSRDLLSLITPMLVTQPPCKAIDICVKSPAFESYERGGQESFTRPGMSTIKYLYRLQTLRSEEGITCKQLLDALSQHAYYVWRVWMNSSQYLRNRIEKMDHFTDGVWVVPGRPKIFLKLGVADQSVTDRSDGGWSWHAPNTPPIERQLEWLPRDLVRVRKYMEVRDGRIYRYPADLEYSPSIS